MIFREIILCRGHKIGSKVFYKGIVYNDLNCLVTNGPKKKKGGGTR